MSLGDQKPSLRVHQQARRDQYPHRSHKSATCPGRTLPDTNLFDDMHKPSSTLLPLRRIPANGSMKFLYPDHKTLVDQL